MGVVTGTEGLRVTHMLYADDLTLTANDPSSPIAENVETTGIVCCQERTYSKCAEILHT